ncbi:nucleoid-associated protein [Mannheimia sp. E30BD]|uniref:nucleoid-associated protein n=1 Tax=Mannheimia sp. E30BD TaxID=3278708 RepID=UPI00359E1922
MAKHYTTPNHENETYYIQWIQRGSTRLPSYIQDFIPVGMKIDNGISTSSLLKNIKNYTASVFSDPKIRHQVETEVVTLLRTKFDHNNEVHIEEDIDVLLNNALNTHGIKGKSTFFTYRQENNIILDSSFKVDESKLRKYEKFDLSLSNKNIQIKGEMQQLGSSVLVVEDENSEKKYLQIELDQEEFEQITKRYKSLLQ